MQITVLAGSPKGEQSVTLQYVLYLQKQLPPHVFRIVPVGSRLRRLETEAAEFQAVREAVCQADALLWCFPVYCFLVPYQLKRFIELVNERGAAADFAGKPASALSTSVHFYDHTAHHYIQGVSEDWGCQYHPGFSAGMDDLLTTAGRRVLTAFGREFVRLAAENAPAPRVFAPLAGAPAEFRPPPAAAAARPAGGRVVLLTDARAADVNLRRMTEVFTRSLGRPVESVNLWDLDLRGGCLGCCRCGDANVCVYRDGMAALWRDRLRPAAAVVYAGTIRDRYLSARWKMYFDRSFFNGHAPVLMGRPLAWLVAGPLRQLPNLRQILEAGAAVGRQPLAGIVSDEDGDPARVAALLRALAARLERQLAAGDPAPENFLGVGGHKLFRDLVYDLRFVFRADYRFYRQHGLWDYPQRDLRRRLRSGLLALFTAIPAFRPAFYRAVPERMVAPFRRLVAAAE